MMCFKRLVPVACVVFLIGMSLNWARADEWDKMTKMTFNLPVELPGVVLAPGTYVFKLMDNPADRNIVQVFNEDQSKVVATVLAIPDYRLEPAGKTIVSFEERQKGAPEAIKAWFYPGDNVGREFVYPKPRAIELAQANQQHVPSMPEATAKSQSAHELMQAPVKAIQPSGQEVQLAEVHKPAPVSTTAEKKPVANAKASPKELPKTASELPLIVLCGSLALAGGLLLRRLSTRRA